MISRIPILLALLAAPWLGISAQAAGTAKEKDRMPFAFGSAKALYDQNIHPRVLLGPEDVTRLKARTREGDGRVILDALRNKLAPTVDKVMAWEEAPETITVETWTKVVAPAFGALLDIAMVSVLDEDARFLAAATRVFAALPAADAIIRKSTRTGMSLPLTHGWAYDLLWHHLTPEVRQAYCRWAVETAVREPIARGSQGYYGSAGGNLKLQGMSNPLATILAIQGDEGVPDLSAELRDSLLRFEATLHVVINPDGYPEEDIGYGTIVAGGMAFLVETTRRAGLYDAYRRCPRFAKFGRSMLHFVQPWGLFLSNTGDHGDDFGRREFVLARLATETNDPTLLWLLGTLTYPSARPDAHETNRREFREVYLSEALPNVPVSAFSLLALDDLAVQPAHPAERDVPTQYRDRRRGIVSFRNGWEDDATFVVFDGSQRSPAAQGHAHDSAGHFSLSALGEYFAIDTGRYNIEQNCHNVTLVNGRSGRSTDGEWRMSNYYGRLTDYQPGDFVDYAAVDSSHQHNCHWAWRHLGLVKGAHSYVWTVDDINEANKLGEYWWQLHTSPENEITLLDNHAVIKGWRHGNLLDVHFALLAPHEYPTPHSLALAQDIAGPSSYKYIPNPAARARQAVRPSDQVHHAVFQRPRLLAKVTGYNGRFMSLMLPRAGDAAPAAVERLPSIDASLAVKITFPDVEDIIIFAYDHQLLQAADIVGRGQWCVVRRSRATGEVLAWQLSNGTELAVGGRQLDITRETAPMTQTTSAKDAFVRNRERYIAVFGDDLGYVPPTEWSRKAGMGEIIRSRGGAERFEHAKPPASHAGIARLSAAYRETGDEQYAEAAKAYYLEWIREHPMRDEAVKARTRVDSIAHGLYGWLGTLHLLLASPAFDEQTTAAIIDSARDQLDFLHDNIYPDRNLRNTYAASLLCNGLRLAFLPEAARWIAFGAHVMSDSSHRQINPDGSHMEATPHYHFCTMGDILNAFRKARLLPELGMNMPAEKVASLFDYLTAATHPTGWVTGLHDGTYGHPAKVRGKGIADALEERAAFRASLGLPEVPLPTVQIFPDAGQAFLRDAWTNDATYLTFDATRCRSYHWHPSRNAIQLQAFGRMLLVDPGRFSYRDPAWKEYALRTRAHSTINLNGWDQARTPATLRHRAAPGYDLVEGFYSGGYWEEEYGRGMFAEHHRTLLWIRDRCIVVIDHLFSPTQQPKPRLECVWQLSEGAVTIEPEARRAYTGHQDANLLMLFPLQPEGMTLSAHEGETEPLRGWVPRKFETEYLPAPQVVLSAEGFDPWSADFATVLIPYRGTEIPQVTATAPVDPAVGSFHHPGYGRITLRWEDGATDDIYWRRKLETALDARDEFITDGSLVHLRKDAGGRLMQGLVVDGTYIAPYTKEKREHAGTFAL